MAIRIGDKLPSIDLQYKTGDGVQTINSNQPFASGTAVLIPPPGAITPTCPTAQLPGCLDDSDGLFSSNAKTIPENL